MNEICNSCHNDKACTTHEPRFLINQGELKWDNCLLYTCIRGYQSARQARIDSEPEEFDVSGVTKLGWRFGTTHKPTREGNFQRFVDVDGRVYFKDQNNDNCWRRTGRIFSKSSWS